MNEMNFFSYPSEVIVGDGTLNKLFEKKRRDYKNVLVITGQSSMKKAGILDKIKELTKKQNAECNIFSGITTNPKDIDVNSVSNYCKEIKPDCIIGIGGTSSIDVAKMIAMLETNQGEIKEYFKYENHMPKQITNESIPMIAIPTTSGGGSEATPYAVLTLSKEKVKKAINSQKIYPKSVIIDTSLLELMPKNIVAITGFDAFAQSLEAFISKKRTNISNFFALQSIRLIANNFESSWEGISKARENMGWASFFSGLSIGITETNLGHALADPISAQYNIQHGMSIIQCIIQSIKFNEKQCYDEFNKIERIFYQNNEEFKSSQKSLSNKIFELISKFDINLGLKQFNINENDLEKFMEQAIHVGSIKTNPTIISTKDMMKMYKKIWVGDIE